MQRPSAEEGGGGGRVSPTQMHGAYLSTGTVGSLTGLLGVNTSAGCCCCCCSAPSMWPTGGLLRYCCGPTSPRRFGNVCRGRVMLGEPDLADA